MSSSDSHDDPPPSGQELSRDAITPRGGFMARPGLKPPPRHAVVVRGGDAPLSEHIPVARSSFPPPPPASEEPPVSLSEKITLRAIPTPTPPVAVPITPRIASIVFDDVPVRAASASTTMLPPVLESAPPPSDAPTVSNIEMPESTRGRSRQRSSRWTIFAAGAGGLILGLASVAATTRSPQSAAPSTFAAPPLPDLPSVAIPPPPPPAKAAASASAGVREPASPDRAQTLAQPRPAVPSAKKSIF